MSQEQKPQQFPKQPEVATVVDAGMIKVAGEVIGLDFTPAEAELMTKVVNINYANYATLRQHELGNAPIPAFHFDPRLAGHSGPQDLPLHERKMLKVKRPDRLE